MTFDISFPESFYDCLKRYFHTIEFHKEQFLLGFKEESLTLNLLILIAKNYIYTCKCKLKEKIPNIIELKYRIKNYYSLEQYISIKNNNLKGFEKYWAPVKHVFPDFYLRIGTWVYYVIYVYVFYLYQLGVSY